MLEVSTKTFSLSTLASGKALSCWLMRCIFANERQKSRLRRVGLTILLGLTTLLVEEDWPSLEVWSCVSARMKRTCKLKALLRALSLDSNIHWFFDVKRTPSSSPSLSGGGLEEISGLTRRNSSSSLSPSSLRHSEAVSVSSGLAQRDLIWERAVFSTCSWCLVCGEINIYF